MGTASGLILWNDGYFSASSDLHLISSFRFSTIHLFSILSQDENHLGYTKFPGLPNSGLR